MLELGTLLRLELSPRRELRADTDAWQVCI